MACCRDPKARRAGYATAAAVVIATGLGLLASAVTASALTEMRAEQAWLQRDQDQRRLDSAQAAALETLMLQAGEGRLLWRETIDGAEVETLAEPEAAKLRASTAKAGGAPLSDLGVTDAEALIRAIRAVPARAGLFGLADAAPAEGWRRCGLSFISPYGLAQIAPSLAAPAEPAVSAHNPRAGQVWRIRARLPDGQTEDRVVRFTGRPETPVLTLERRRQGRQPPGDPCAAVTEGTNP
ncbi:MAG TPA: hypothetical protein VEA44_16005 [Caulobacter sp.]|nr:hypothetical protein [Caulobacter sp.]